MSLNTATLLVIIGITASLVLRTAGTIFPAMFANICIVGFVSAVLLCTSLAMVNFLYAFSAQYIRRKQKILRTACSFALIGTAASVFLDLRSIFIVLKQPILPNILMTHGLDAALPLFSSTTLLIFFISFSREMAPMERERLGRAVRSAINGSSIFAIVHAVVLINYLSSSRFRWLSSYIQEAALWMMPILIIAVLLIVHFFFSFYRFLHVFPQERGL
ncbi:MAG: hypothetical protein ACP5G0_03665 [Desulfomonilia bacterium]